MGMNEMNYFSEKMKNWIHKNLLKPIVQQINSIDYEFKKMDWDQFNCR
jgi:hypothetical protein